MINEKGIFAFLRHVVFVPDSGMIFALDCFSPKDIQTQS